MASSNNFIPLFHPLLDTFDSLRRSSDFCLAAILAVASRVEAHSDHNFDSVKIICEKESRRLAAESLFESPTRLESVQAMIILAAWSEKTWFAIGHAVQMALDMRLQAALPRLLAEESSAALLSGQTNAPNLRLAREVRTWLVLNTIEREIAVGTAREPRLKDEIDGAMVRKFLVHPSSRLSDMRFISIVELIQLRGMSWSPSLVCCNH